jgi:hypothetical protein
MKKKNKKIKVSALKKIKGGGKFWSAEEINEYRLNTARNDAQRTFDLMKSWFAK